MRADASHYSGFGNLMLAEGWTRQLDEATSCLRLDLDGDGAFTIFDMLGREVARIVSADHQPGWYDAPFDASNLASGVYFYRMTARAAADKSAVMTQTRNMVIH